MVNTLVHNGFFNMKYIKNLITNTKEFFENFKYHNLIKLFKFSQIIAIIIFLVNLIGSSIVYMRAAAQNCTPIDLFNYLFITADFNTFHLFWAVSVIMFGTLLFVISFMLIFLSIDESVGNNLYEGFVNTTTKISNTKLVQQVIMFNEDIKWVYPNLYNKLGIIGLYAFIIIGGLIALIMIVGVFYTLFWEDPCQFIN